MENIEDLVRKVHSKIFGKYDDVDRADCIYYELTEYSDFDEDDLFKLLSASLWNRNRGVRDFTLMRAFF